MEDSSKQVKSDGEKKPSFLIKVITGPIYALAKPIDALFEMIRKKCEKRIKENCKIAENSDLYSDFSVKAAKHKAASFREHLAVFRTNSLSMFDSLYNTSVIKLTEKSSKHNNKIRRDYEQIPKHPHGWQDEQRVIYKKNIWDFLIILLSVIPKTLSFFRNTKIHIVKNYRLSLKSLALFASVAVCSTLLVSYIYNAITEDVQLKVFIDGATVGMVESKETLNKAISEANKYMSAKTDTNYSFSGNITYELVSTHDNSFVSEEQLTARIIDIAKEPYVPAYVLYIDDTRVAAASSRSAINSVISSLESAKLRQFANSGIDAATVNISNSIRIEDLFCTPDCIYSAYDIYLMLNDSDDIRFYNDSSSANNSSEEDISTLVNPIVIENEQETEDDVVISALSLEEGTESSSGNVSPADVSLVFSAVVTEELSDVIAYETVYEYSEYYDIGTFTTKTHGENGQVIYKYEVSYIDGKEQSRTLVSTECIKEPVNEVILIGLANPPSAEPTGEFIYPLTGRIYISSLYGSYRSNTSYHYGIDLIADYGTPILAADGGTVIFAGSYSSYGNIVMVDHGNGFVTYYAHMQKIIAEEGQQVYQGQIIGLVGSTGTASCAHLHFEIRKDGNTTDPLDYLPETDK